MKNNQEDLTQSSPLNPVVYTDALSETLLKQLFSHQICVICIRDYISKNVCSKIHERLVFDPQVNNYTHDIETKNQIKEVYYGVKRFGYPLNQIYNDTDGKKTETYFKQALPTIKKIRDISSPFLSPIDRLRLELDEHWSFGANLARIEGKKALSGIFRIMPAELSNLSEDNPHCDSVLDKYFPTIKGQFAASIYLNVPTQGGELEIWDVPPFSNDEMNDFGPISSWRSKLNESIKIKPEQGDLMLFSTRRPHAITKFDSAIRTSLQTFIGIDDSNKIFVWN